MLLGLTHPPERRPSPPPFGRRAGRLKVPPRVPPALPLPLALWSSRPAWGQSQGARSCSHARSSAALRLWEGTNTSRSTPRSSYAPRSVARNGGVTVISAAELGRAPVAAGSPPRPSRQRAAASGSSPSPHHRGPLDRPPECRWRGATHDDRHRLLHGPGWASIPAKSTDGLG